MCEQYIASSGQYNKVEGSRLKRVERVSDVARALVGLARGLTAPSM
jgi:hypothetical protein